MWERVLEAGATLINSLKSSCSDPEHQTEQEGWGCCCLCLADDRFGIFLGLTSMKGATQENTASQQKGLTPRGFSFPSLRSVLGTCALRVHWQASC